MSDRKTAVHTATHGRDKGKRFLVTEMSSADAERWGMSAMLLLMKGNPEIPDEAELGGMAAIARYGLRAVAGMDDEKALALMDELMACVQVLPDPKNNNVVRPLSPGGEDISEVVTRLELKSEVFELHTGFSVAGAVSRSISAAKESPASSPIEA